MIYNNKFGIQYFTVLASCKVGECEVGLVHLFGNNNYIITMVIFYWGNYIKYIYVDFTYVH